MNYNEKNWAYISDEDANKLIPHWAILPERPAEKKTFVEQVKNNVGNFLVQNKGANFMAVAYFFNAVSQGKSSEDVIKDLKLGYKTGQELEKLYDWVVNKLRS